MLLLRRNYFTEMHRTKIIQTEQGDKCENCKKERLHVWKLIKLYPIKTYIIKKQKLISVFNKILF